MLTREDTILAADHMLLTVKVHLLTFIDGAGIG